MRALGILLAAVILLPVASAGDEANPEIVDRVDANIRDGSLDFISAWFEPHPTGLQFTIKVREATALLPDHGWAVAFDLGGSRYLPILGVDAQGKLHGCACEGENKIGPADGWPDDLKDVAFRAGKPAYFTALIPYAKVPGLGPGAVLENVGASSETFASDGYWKDYNGNAALDGYGVQRAFLPPALAHALPYIVGGVGLVGLGAGGAWLVLRRSVPRAPAAPSGASLAREPDETGRMLLRPPR